VQITLRIKMWLVTSHSRKCSSFYVLSAPQGKCHYRQVLRNFDSRFNTFGNADGITVHFTGYDRCLSVSLTDSNIQVLILSDN